MKRFNFQHPSNTAPLAPSSSLPNLNAGKSKIHLYCILVLLLLIVLRFFILPIPSSFGTQGDPTTNYRLPKHVKQQFLKQQHENLLRGQEENNNNNDHDVDVDQKPGGNNNMEEFELPQWVVEDLPQKKTENLGSLNQEPPQYPKETNNDADAKKAVEGVIARVFGDDHKTLFDEFMKVFSVEVHEEDNNNNKWCKAPSSNSKIPECFKIEFSSSSSSSFIKLHLVGTTRIMATKGFYHILKYFLESSVMWGVGRSGINLNHYKLEEYLTTSSNKKAGKFWERILVDKLIESNLGIILDEEKKEALITSSDVDKNKELLKLVGTKLLPHISQQQPGVHEDHHDDEKTSSEFFDEKSNTVTIIHSAHTPLRYNYNLCTFAYTMAWWEWDEWEREIDWMVLHGVNMPLALVGQEAVWLKLWTEVLFPPSANNNNNNNRFSVSTQDVLENHFSGAAFWPWHWMGNLRKWAGPVSLEYIEKRSKLQKKILKRMRELKMFFALPAFAGHVPEKVGRILSDWFDEDLPREDQDPFSRAEIMSPSEWINSFLKDSVVGKLLKSGGGGGGENDDNNNNKDNNKATNSDTNNNKRLIRRRRRNPKTEKKTSDHIRRSALWMGFNGKFSGVVTLSPSHPLFAKISYHFMQTLTEMYGSAHFYSADQFNEMPPPTLHPTFLAQSGRAVVDGIQRVNPHGRWVVQGWLFLHHHRIWRKAQVKDYLDGAGKGNVVVLDLASDIRDLISIHDHFYGHDHIWCLLHNFGGRRGIFGHMPMIVEKMVHSSYWQALKGRRQNKNLVGFGMTMEATHHNPALYELTTDLMFTDAFTGGNSNNNNNNDQLQQPKNTINNNNLLTKKLIDSYPASTLEFSQQDGQVHIQNTRPSRKFAEALLSIWWRSFILYRYQTQTTAEKSSSLVRSKTTTTSTINSNNNIDINTATIIFSRLSSVDGPYAHPHDCCPSFSLIPFQPIVYSMISQYGMRGGSDLDTQYRPDSLFGASSLLLTKLHQQQQQQNKNRIISDENKNNNKYIHLDNTLVYDAIDYTRQSLDTVFYEMHDVYQRLLSMCAISMKVSGRNNKNLKNCPLRDDIKNVADEMIKLIESLDDLSCGSANFDLYDSWLKPAMEHWSDENNNNNDNSILENFKTMNGKVVLTSDEDLEADTYNEKDFKQYWKRSSSAQDKNQNQDKNNNKKNIIISFSKSDALFNAKNLITAWGDSKGQGYPNYAGRSWCGLYKRLYAKRWRRLFDTIQREVDMGGFESIMGTTGQVRNDIAKLDWNFCVDHRKDIKRFDHEEDEEDEKKRRKTASNENNKRGGKAVLDVARRWLKFSPSSINQNEKSTWFSSFSPEDDSSSSSAMKNDFELLSSPEIESCPKISIKALKEAVELTSRGSLEDLHDDAGSTSSALYILRQHGAWSFHPVATAASCRAMKHCVGIDSYGAIYFASDRKIFREKLCSLKDGDHHIDDSDDSNKKLPKDRYFYIRV